MVLSKLSLPGESIFEAALRLTDLRDSGFGWGVRERSKSKVEGVKSRKGVES